MKLFRSLLLTLFVFGFAGWVYIAGNAWFHPESLAWPLTHFAPWPREDTFGAVCFAVSFISFFFWNYTRDTKNKFLFTVNRELFSTENCEALGIQNKGRLRSSLGRR